MQAIAEDLSDITSEKGAFQFLSRCVTVWAQPPAPLISNGSAQPSTGLPGFERFVYERLVPSAFSVLSSPQFNIKDGQASLVRSPLLHKSLLIAHRDIVVGRT